MSSRKYFKAYDHGEVGASPTINLEYSTHNRIVLVETTTTPVFSAPPLNGELSLIVTQNDTGGRDFVSPSNWLYSNITEPIWTNGTANQFLLLKLTYLRDMDQYIVNFVSGWEDPVSFPDYNWSFEAGSSIGNLEDGTGTLSEISGADWCGNIGNESYWIGGHDSNTGRVFIIDDTGARQGDIILTGATMTDVEELSIINDGGTHKVIVGAFGDNNAIRTTKQLFRFDEPTVTGVDITIPNDGSWEQIDFQYPPTPLWEGGSNLGDAEAMVVDMWSATKKIIIISKRETVNKIFSLVYQTGAYAGTQILTYEGEMHPMVVEEVGGFVSPSNAVGACVSKDGLHVLVKTYDKVYQFSRGDYNTSIVDMLKNTQPVEVVEYVGSGSHPTQEPQGETIFFKHDDSAFYTVSESGTGSAVDGFPIFEYPRSSTLVGVQHGLNGYVSSEDTYIWKGLNEGVNYGSAQTFVVDKNVSDERFGLLKFGGLDTLFSGKTVKTAQLQLYVDTEGQGADFHKILTKDWSEGTVTYTSFSTGGFTAGVDYVASPCGSWVGVDGYVGSIAVDIDIDVVQDWIDNPSNNKGLLVVAIHVQDGQQFDSNENVTQANNPMLKVTTYD